MKVLIYPTDDRLGQASLIDHYNRIGSDVYLPARGALGFNWSRMSLWPSLLCKSSEAGLRNIDKNKLHTVETFGEDLFLDSTIFSNNEKDLPICNLLTEDEIRNLKNFLNSFFDEIKIILYIRNQINAAASIWSTAVMSGLPWIDFPSPEIVSYAFNHKNTIELWRTIFGNEIEVRIFQSKVS